MSQHPTVAFRLERLGQGDRGDGNQIRSIDLARVVE